MLPQQQRKLDCWTDGQKRIRSFALYGFQNAIISHVTNVDDVMSRDREI